MICLEAALCTHFESLTAGLFSLWENKEIALNVIK